MTIDLILGQRAGYDRRGFHLSVTVAHSLPDSALVSQHIGSAYTILCASPEYLRQHGVPESVETIAGHTCLQLLVGDMLPGQWIFDAPATEVFRLGRTISFPVNIAESMAQSLREGLGIAPLPVRVALPYLRDGSLAVCSRNIGFVRTMFVRSIRPGSMSMQESAVSWRFFARMSRSP